MLDRSYFEALDVRDLRELLASSGVHAVGGVFTLERADGETADRILGVGHDRLEAMLDALVFAARAGWFGSVEKPS